MNNRLKIANLKVVFRALKHRNFKLFFIGQSISLIGSWMQQIAISWLVYSLSNSVFLLGLIGFLGQLPTLLFAPFAGVIADRHHRHRIIIMTQILAMIQAFILAFLVLSKHVEIWHLIVLSIFLGLISSLDIPVRQSFIIEMLENKEDLSNAIALNSSMVNMAKLVGPSIAGIVIAAAGEGVCFLLNGISYVAVIISLLMMKIKDKELKFSRRPVLHNLKEGFNYAYNFEPIRYILLLLAIVSLTAVPYSILMPVFAKDIFHGGPQTLGFLVAMAGIGAFIGALYLAGRSSVVGLGRILAWASACFGIGIIIFAESRILWLSMILLLGTGFAMIVQAAASNTILQTIVDEDKRGRIMSFYTMAFMGMMPLGSLLAGTLASKIGAPNTLILGGSCCFISAILFLKKLPAIRAKIRPIYIKKGIIPEVARGIGAAAEFEAYPEK